MRKTFWALPILMVGLLATSCQQKGAENQAKEGDMKEKVAEYATVKLTTDLSKLTDKEKQMIPILMEAGRVMDTLFWYQTYGNLDSLINAQKDQYTREFVQINYGPWDRLSNDEPFIKGIGTKPLGANFYPKEMTKDEFENADLPDKAGLYNFIRRDEKGNLYTVPYHEKFKDQLSRAANLLRQAADLAEDAGLKKYLNLRADALQNDDFRASDLAWLDMKNNSIDVTIGPIETYED